MFIDITYYIKLYAYPIPHAYPPVVTLFLVANNTVGNYEPLYSEDVNWSHLSAFAPFSILIYVHGRAS